MVTKTAVPQHNHVIQHHIPTEKLIFFFPLFFTPSERAALTFTGASLGEEGVSSTKASSQLLPNTPTSTGGYEDPQHPP